MNATDLDALADRLAARHDERLDAQHAAEIARAREQLDLDDDDELTAVRGRDGGLRLKIVYTSRAD